MRFKLIEPQRHEGTKKSDKAGVLVLIAYSFELINTVFANEVKQSIELVCIIFSDENLVYVPDVLKPFDVRF